MTVDDPEYLESIGDALALRDRAREMGLEMGAAGDADDAYVLSGYNGFGPDRWEPGRRAMLSKRFSEFLPAVLVHDIDYARGGSQKDRILADDRLRRNLKRLIDSHKWYDRAWQRPLLDPVMLIVDKQGKPGWHEKSAAYRAGFASALRKLAGATGTAGASGTATVSTPPQIAHPYGDMTISGGGYSVSNPPARPSIAYFPPPETKSTGVPGLSGKGAPTGSMDMSKVKLQPRKPGFFEGLPARHPYISNFLRNQVARRANNADFMLTYGRRF